MNLSVVLLVIGIPVQSSLKGLILCLTFYYRFLCKILGFCYRYFLTTSVIVYQIAYILT